MRLYASAGSPTSRRVHMFFADKGIDVPVVQMAGPG
jgi:glutathione S-transferase